MPGDHHHRHPRLRTWTGSVVRGNTAEYAAGGIANWLGTVTLTTSVVRGNTAVEQGGGIAN